MCLDAAETTRKTIIANVRKVILFKTEAIVELLFLTCELSDLIVCSSCWFFEVMKVMTSSSKFLLFFALFFIFNLKKKFNIL